MSISLKAMLKEMPSNLTSLDLAGNELSAAAFKALARSESIKQAALIDAT